MPTQLEINLPPMPARIEKLPRDERGFPVPWFVSWIDGKPEFRVIGPDRFGRAVEEGLCWICGERLGRYLAFTIGPMCLVNRISAEPPAHRECAEFAVKACPFLSNAKMRRNEKALPAHEAPGGGMILRNPGVGLVYITTGYSLIMDNTESVLCALNEPTELLWFTRGREATHEEIMGSIESGLPLLREIAERDGPEAVAFLNEQYRAAMELIAA